MSDDEIEKLAQGYAGQDFRKRKVVTEEAMYAGFTEEWKLQDFIQQVSQAVPEQYRDKAVVEFSGGGYEESGSFRITYTRPETDEEVSDRVRQALDYARSSIAAERNQYLRLKAKFG